MQRSLQGGSEGHKLPQHGQRRSPSLERFLKKFDRIEFVFINCLPHRKVCARF